MDTHVAFFTRRDLRTIGRWCLVSLPRVLVLLAKRLLWWGALGVLLFVGFVFLCVFHFSELSAFVRAGWQKRKRISLQ